LSQYDSSAASSLQSLGTSLLNDLPTVLLPYVNIQSECAIGYCSWSGIPRAPDTNPNTESSTNNDAMNQLNQTETDKNTYSNAVVSADQSCQNVTNAYQQYWTAEQNYQSSTNSANLQALQDAEQTYSQFYYSNQEAGVTLTNAMNQLNTDLSNEPSVTGSDPSGGGSNPNSGAFNNQNTGGSQSAPMMGGVNCPCTCPSPSTLTTP
jgi:hypothetical protein